MRIDFSHLRVNPERLKADFEALAEIGAGEGGEINRPALGEAHLAARRWFRERCLAAGLDFRTDTAGNHSAHLPCASPNAPVLLLGSHLDSVPGGGRFDGALGVLAALEALRVVKAAGLVLPVNLEAIDFTDEEGTLVGLLGSSALAGTLQAGDLVEPRGGRLALLAGLDRSGLTEKGLLAARRDPGSLAGYLELHIEQGNRLIAAGAEIGVVTEIVGIASYRLAFTGRADHAGTMPVQERLDAAQGAGAFTLETRRLILETFPDCVANIGWIMFSPGAFNIVPARASLALEFRAPRKDRFLELERALLDLAQALARQFGLGLEVEFLGKHQPTPLSPAVAAAIRDAAETLGLRIHEMSSGAGHDAQSMAAVCPSGMVFVPSVEGASHSRREFTPWPDCVNGANVLLLAALHFASRFSD
jgi:N-carbamoyl-L-amino-acid hydrolase